MSHNSRLLTKSKFITALSCPTKLFYTDKKQYPNCKTEDSFLESLAEGGFQVGELAKCYHPEGIYVGETDYKSSLKKTTELLKRENVTIFEAAVKYKDFFIRIDILKKNKTQLKLIEVKAKSFNGNNPNQFLNQNGEIGSGWSYYLYDVAFQKYVLTSAFPKSHIKSYLLLADKNKKATVDGLNQKFKIVKDNRGRKSVKICGNVEKDSLGEELLVQIQVDQYIDMINHISVFNKDSNSLADDIKYLSNCYKHDKKIVTSIGAKCKNCEFQSSTEQEKNNLINSFKECWCNVTNLKPKDLNNPLVLDIYNFKDKDKLISQGKYLLKDCDLSDFNVKKGKIGLSTSERQWIQIEKVKKNDNSPYIDKIGLKTEMESWTYPLHMIDFETSMVAIPFNKGRRPYEGIAFQFSHHIIQRDGTISHKGQYINLEQGSFPNFDFTRSLKKELEVDNGTIFRYAAHENSFLNLIYQQLSESNKNEVPDKENIITFIKSITHSSKNSFETWKGERDMVDLLELIKKYYYHPLMGGSNSIKTVLPAVLNDSKYLQDKYSKPIYGSKTEINSLNFKDWVWIRKDDNNKVIDPYKLLPNLFSDIKKDELKSSMLGSTLADGGAALTAYARMQFSNISQREKESITKGLLRYCELDTFAMVLIWEYWKSLILDK